MKHLYHKFTVTRTDGREIPVGAEFFVLRIDSDPVARDTLHYYALLMAEQGETDFADELFLLLSKYKDDK